MGGGYLKKEGKYVKRRELLEILEKIPEDKRNEAKILFDELIFLLSTLKKLKKQIKDNGTIEDFEQGSQKFKRESPALKSYNQTMKTFDTFYKNFISLVPKETYTPPEDEFDEFNK